MLVYLWDYVTKSLEMCVDESHDTKRANPQFVSCDNGTDMQDFPIQHYAV